MVSCVLTVSLSEGSEDTGDELQNRQKKKRSLRSKKKKALQASLVASPPWSDSDLLSLPTGQYLLGAVAT